MKWLLRSIIPLALLSVSIAAKPSPPVKNRQADSEELGKALDYFQGGKFHEALVILARLDSTYRLNPRFRAYTGLCFYYEDDFKNTTRLLDAVLPSLKAFAPQERAVYYRADAESHFELKEMEQAAAAYDSLLANCRENEKAEAYMRLGFIHTMRHDWLSALGNMQSALVYFRRYEPQKKARIAQLRNMIAGCCEKIDEERQRTADKESISN